MSGSGGRDGGCGQAALVSRGRRAWWRPAARVLGGLALVAAMGVHPSPAWPMIAREAASAVAAPTCPYDFLSEMPVGRFCVYRGRATGADGLPCDGDVLVIWSSHRGAGADDAPPPRRDVYFGIVDMPSLLLRAVAEHATEAALADYQRSPDEAPIALDGLSTLDRSPVGPGTLTMTLSDPLPFGDSGAACAADAYRGEFIGVLDLACRGPSMSCRQR